MTGYNGYRCKRGGTEWDRHRGATEKIREKAVRGTISVSYTEMIREAGQGTTREAGQGMIREAEQGNLHRAGEDRMREGAAERTIIYRVWSCGSFPGNLKIPA